FSARSYLARGALYERTFFRYDSALVSYAKGKTEFVSTEIVPICAQRADYLTRYFQLHNEYVFYDSARQALIAESDSTHQGALRDTTLPPRDTVRSVEPPPRETAHTAEGSRETLHSGLGGRDSVRSPLVPIMPHVVVTLDSADIHLARCENELGGLFYATIGIPDSAEYWYRRVVGDFPSSPYVPRALFTLAQVYFGRDSVAYKSTVDSLHHEILDHYPLSEFAPESRRLLGLPPQEITHDSAEVHYTEAEKLMLAGDTAKAAEGFKDLAQKYPSSPFASRALYAAGWMYEYQMLNADSAIASYERLLTLYPRSIYASKITGKIAEVIMKRKSAAAPDSSAARRVGPAPGPQVPGQQGGLLKSPVPPAVPDSAIQRGLPRKGKEGPTPE
ncbi:MAG TPA: outer membrane protein assembly factor BamD, partial [Bacteroidota bacterium]|nr:outer membrane protein assembly factor BamD [Bacteroidota bacterium]